MPDQQDSKHIILQKIWSRVSRGIGFTLAIYFFLTTILMQLFDWGIFGFREDGVFVPLLLIVIVRMFIEFWLLFGMMTTLSSAFALNTIAVIWFVGIAFAIIALLLSVAIIMRLGDKSRQSFWRLPWLHLALLFWVVSSLVLVPKDTLSMKWEMQRIDLSRQLEQRQFGPLFLFAQYLNRMRNITEYRIDHQEDGTIIVQQFRHLFYNMHEEVSSYALTFSGDSDQNTTLVEIQGTALEQEYSGFERFNQRYENLENLPDGVECVSINVDVIGPKDVCRALQFNGANIFQVKGDGVHVKSVVHDDANARLFIHFTPYFSDSEQVSLVKLPH